MLPSLALAARPLAIALFIGGVAAWFGPDAELRSPRSGRPFWLLVAGAAFFAAVGCYGVARAVGLRSITCSGDGLRVRGRLIAWSDLDGFWLEPADAHGGVLCIGINREPRVIEIQRRLLTSEPAEVVARISTWAAGPPALGGPWSLGDRTVIERSLRLDPVHPPDDPA